MLNRSPTHLTLDEETIRLAVRVTTVALVSEHNQMGKIKVCSNNVTRGL